MRFLRYMLQRFTVAAGLKYRGSMTSDGRTLYVYSNCPVVTQTSFGMEFQGGMLMYADGGCRSGSYGRAVALCTDPKGKVRSYRSDSGRRRGRQ